MIFCHQTSTDTSPRMGVYHLKLVPKSKEISAKISVLVTIFVIDQLIDAK